MSNFRISNHQEVYNEFKNKLKLLQQSNTFDSGSEEILSKPIITEKLVFNLGHLVQNNEHLTFITEISRFYKIANTAKQFSILRKQLEKSLQNISGFHLAFQNSVHNDLICHDRDAYLSRNQTGWVRGVDTFVTNSFDDVALFSLLEVFIECFHQCFPELLNDKNASSICSILSRLKLPVEIDLKHLYNLSLKSDEKFLNVMMTCYFKRLDRTEYFVKVFKCLMKSELPNMTLSLIKNIKTDRLACLLKEKDITREDRDLIFGQCSHMMPEILSLFVDQLGHLWDNIEISQQLFYNITPYFLKSSRYDGSSFTDLYKFFKYVRVDGMNEQEVLDHLVHQWLKVDKLQLYRMFAHKSIDGYMSDEGKLIVNKIDAIINPNNVQKDMFYSYHQNTLTRVFKTECENDVNFLISLLLPENYEIFCLLPPETVEIVMKRLVDPTEEFKTLVNIFLLLSLWSTIPHQKILSIPFRADLASFVELIQEKFKWNLKDTYQKYTYQQKMITWIHSNQWELAEVPLIQNWIDYIQRYASFDKNQVLLNDNSNIIFHSNGQMLLKNRWCYEMLDQNGYLMWKIERNCDRDGSDLDLVFGDHFFIHKRKSFNIHSIRDGKLIKELTCIGDLSTKRVQTFREPLSTENNRWYFVTTVEKVSKLEYCVFNPETLEFTPDGFDENFPKDFECFFKFVGSTLLCRQGGFFSRRDNVSLYSITERKFINDFFKVNDVDKICSFGDAIAYVKDGINIIKNDVSFNIPLSKEQRRSFEIYHMNQLDESFTFLIEDYSSKNLLFINRPDNIQTIIVPDDLKRVTFYPTTEGAVCYQDKELIFLTPTDSKRQKISPQFFSKLRTNEIIVYKGFHNGYHVFHKDYVRNDEW